jgi:hypothetical protein
MTGEFGTLSLSGLQNEASNIYASMSSFFGTPSLSNPSVPKTTLMGKIDALPLYVKIGIAIVIVIAVILIIGYALAD